MLLVPKKLTIDIELFANSGNSALAVVLYSALKNYAKEMETQSLSPEAIRKITNEVAFLFSEQNYDVKRNLRNLELQCLLIKDEGGNYVLVETIK